MTCQHSKGFPRSANHNNALAMHPCQTLLALLILGRETSAVTTSVRSLNSLKNAFRHSLVKTLKGRLWLLPLLDQSGAGGHQFAVHHARYAGWRRRECQHQ